MPTMKKINLIILFVVLSNLDSIISAQERSKTVHTTKISSIPTRAMSPRASKVTTSAVKKETPIRSITKKTVLTEEIAPIENASIINIDDNQVELLDQNEVTLDAPEIQNEPVEKDDTKDILEKLALINNIDTNNLKITQDSSYTQLFNNFVGLKNFIVQNFSKTKFQKLCNELIDQIYPEDAATDIDFGSSTPVVTPAKTSSPEIESSVQQAPATTEIASQPIPMNDAPASTGASFDFGATPTEDQSTPESLPESTPEEPTSPEAEQNDAAASQPE